MTPGKKTSYKESIAESFSRSAARYDQIAKVQQRAGHQLLSDMQSHVSDINDAVIADIGCGTGYFYQELNTMYCPEQYIGVDLAQGMLDLATVNHPTAHNALWLHGDAEDLPLMSSSVDLIFANFSLQWSDNLADLMHSFLRVLKPGGICCFTSLGSETLFELRGSWGAVDRNQHVNDFYSGECWSQAMTDCGLNIVHHHQQALVDYYPSVRQLLHSIKGIGASVVKHEHKQGLMGKQHFLSFEQAYESYRTSQGLPATYIVDFWLVQKPAYCRV